MAWSKALEVKITHIYMILMHPLVHSTYTFHGLQTIKGIAPVCVLHSNAISFPGVFPVCLHPEDHVVWWYHKHGIPFVTTFPIVATLYSQVVHNNIWNLSLEHVFSIASGTSGP